MSLEVLVDRSTFSETTDPRDAVYALLNLASDVAPLANSDTLNMVARDYTKHVLYTYAIARFRISRSSSTLLS